MTGQALGVVDTGPARGASEDIQAGGHELKSLPDELAVQTIDSLAGARRTAQATPCIERFAVPTEKALHLIRITRPACLRECFGAAAVRLDQLLEDRALLGAQRLQAVRPGADDQRLLGLQDFGEPGHRRRFRDDERAMRAQRARLAFRHSPSSQWRPPPSSSRTWLISLSATAEVLT